MIFVRLSFILLLCGYLLPFTLAFGISGKVRVPQSAKERDQQAITSIQIAMKSPRVPSVPYIECEFPPLLGGLGVINKLGDGSLRSSLAVDDANIQFTKQLVNSIQFSNIVGTILGNGPRLYVLTSVTATSNFVQKMEKQVPKSSSGVVIHSLKTGLPTSMKSRDVFILVTPASSSDYKYAKDIVNRGNTIVVVNGYAKDTNSIPSDATMAYFYKPLTYNSQISGSLIRCYPNDWCTFNFNGKEIIQTTSDTNILVPNTNTPDLRSAVKLCQQNVDQQAIRARQQQQRK